MAEDRCVICGEVIPEGRQVCPICERKAMETRQFKFTIHTEPRTKKNSSQIVMNPKTHRPFITPSKYYKDFCKECLRQMRGWVSRPTEPIDYPVQVTYLFYKGSKRLVDDLNLSESMDDVLVQGGILADDNRDIVCSHDGTRVYYDKENPRVEITITEVKGWEQWKKK